MVIQPIEPETLELLKKDFPDIIDLWINNQWINLGVPTPAMTLGCQLPAFKKKSTYENEDFEFKFPEGNRVFAENLGIPIEKISDGAYLDLTPETPLDDPIDSFHGFRLQNFWMTRRRHPFGWNWSFLRFPLDSFTATSCRPAPPDRFRKGRPWRDVSGAEARQATRPAVCWARSPGP